MTALAGLRLSAYAPATYTAFRVVDGRTLPIPFPAPARDFAEALQAAQARCWHKDLLAIRETDEAGDRVHLYLIRKKGAAWIRVAGRPVRVEDLYADPMGVVDAGVFGGGM